MVENVEELHGVLRLKLDELQPFKISVLAQRTSYHATNSEAYVSVSDALTRIGFP